MAATLYIDDDSPEIAYFPFVNLEPSSNVSAGWQLLYTGSGAAVNPGQVGVGTSYHYTSLNGASLLINWNGTGIDLFGSVNNALYNISLDGSSSTYPGPVNGTLASFDDLQNTNHSLLLTTIITNTTSPDAFLTFDKARITYTPPSGFSNTTATSQVISNSDIAFIGFWSTESDSSGSAMHVSNTAGDSAETSFTGSAITVYGLTSSYSGNYTVILDNITTNLFALSSYNNSDSLLFYATDLPQNMTHNITFINQENRTLALQVGGVNVTYFGNGTTTPSSSFSSNSVPAGTIAAAVLAAILFLVLVGIFYYACCMRRRARFIARRRRQSSEKVGSDIERTTGLSPPSGEELESTSLSTSKGYGFGLGLRRGFPFAYRKGKMGSHSSGRSRNGTSAHAESHPMTPQWDRDEKRFSISTLAEAFSVLVRAPESEKLAPGWSNPVAPPPSFKYDRCYKDRHGFIVPELRVEQMGPIGNESDDDADLKTLTSRQGEALAATLSLCPRISEAEGAVGSKLSIDTEDGAGRSHETRQREFLQVRDVSPFRVDMSTIFGTRKGNRDSRRTSGSGGSTWSKVRTRLYRRAHRDDGRRSLGADAQETSSSSGPESVPVVMHDSSSINPPSETAPGSGSYSFLDFTSSHVSLRRQSKTTLSSTPAEVGHGPRDISAWSDNTSVRIVKLERSREDSLSPKPDAPSTASGGSHPSDNSGSHTELAPSPTTRTHQSLAFPFTITIPPPPTDIAPPANNVPERHITPPPEPSQQIHVPRIAPPELALISPVDSPTESVPFSVSEIQFRHSSSEYTGLDSRRASEASALPPHPPLPHTDGSQPNTPAHSPPPPYIVQRVLGLATSPLSPLSVTMPPLSIRRPGTAPTLVTSPTRVGSLLGPRPLHRPSTAGSVRVAAAPQLPMQGGRGNIRSPRHDGW